MKYRTTQKAVNAGYANKICVSYCALQNLLNHESPVAYTTRREGWGADIYEINASTAIITGYSPFGNIRPAYDVCRRYDEKAEKIRCNYSLTWEEQKDALQELLKKFVEEVTKK